MPPPARSMSLSVQEEKPEPILQPTRVQVVAMVVTPGGNLPGICSNTVTMRMLKANPVTTAPPPKIHRFPARAITPMPAPKTTSQNFCIIPLRILASLPNRMPAPIPAASIRLVMRLDWASVPIPRSSTRLGIRMVVQVLMPMNMAPWRAQERNPQAWRRQSEAFCALSASAGPDFPGRASPAEFTDFPVRTPPAGFTDFPVRASPAEFPFFPGALGTNSR